MVRLIIVKSILFTLENRNSISLHSKPISWKISLSKHCILTKNHAGMFLLPASLPVNVAASSRHSLSLCQYHVPQTRFFLVFMLVATKLEGSPSDFP